MAPVKSITHHPLIMFVLGLVLVEKSHAFYAGITKTARTPRTSTKRPPHTTVQPDLLCMYSINNSNSNNNNNLSASARERRNEETRRISRKEEVVPGKTSAKPGEKDYEINPSVTETEYLRQLPRDEQEICRQTDIGMNMLKMFRLKEANEAFQKVFDLKPNAYLWHAGIVKFYLGDVEEAAKIFARNAEQYESRFGSPASEERIWRDACELAFINKSFSKRKRQEVIDERIQADIPLLTPILSNNNSSNYDEDGLFPTETRKVYRIARELFAASLNNDYSTVVLSQAKLRSICGASQKNQPQQQRRRGVQSDTKMWKLTAAYYLGLHHDALGEVEESKACMKIALLQCPSVGNADDIIHTLPALHMVKRDWYDDDAFFLENEEDTKPKEATTPTSGDGIFLDGSSFSARPTKIRTTSTTRTTSIGPTTDPVVINSIRNSISKLNSQQLKDALRTRGLKAYGPKEELQDSFFHALMGDVGLDVFW